MTVICEHDGYWSIEYEDGQRMTGLTKEVLAMMMFLQIGKECE